MDNRNGKTSETKRPAWFRNLFSFRFFTEEDRKISDKAIIDPAAEIADDVEIGPFCVIGPNVKIDAGCILHNNVTVSGNTTSGRDNIFFPNSVIIPVFTTTALPLPAPTRVPLYTYMISNYSQKSKSN